MLPEAVTSQASKIRIKSKAVAFFTFQRKIAVVLLSSVLTSSILFFILARWSPCIYIKIFASHKPIHSTFLRPCWDEHKFFAHALLARCIEFLPKVTIIMGIHFMSAKAFRKVAKP